MLPVPRFNKIVTVTSGGIGTYKLGGGLLDTTRYAYFKFKISNPGTTNVGIKIPITRNVASDLVDSTNAGLSFQKYSAVGDSPDITTANAFGFDRTKWITTSDASFIYIYTTDSTQKTYITSGVDYWFGIEVKGQSGDMDLSITVDTSKAPNSDVANNVGGFIRAGFYNVYNTTGTCTVKDYNAA